MASRAPVIHDYSLASLAGQRPRRRVGYYNPTSDPVVLPPPRVEASPVLVISALIASSLIAGATYALYFSGTAPLADTPAAPLERSFSPDGEVFRANTVELLQGRAQAVPSTTSAETSAETGQEPELPAYSPPYSPPESSLHDSQQLGKPQLPAPAKQPALPTQPVYPNPVTTPPDAIGPELDLNRPAPGIDPENPY